MTPEQLVEVVMSRPGPVRLVAIDGPGGAGKSTFAARLAAAAGGAPVVHTDDFASADNPIDWWPRLLDQVITPLTAGQQAHYQRYDWPTESLAEWRTVEPSPIVIIEGVSAGRAEWRRHLSFVIWIETPRALRLARAVDRDGDEALDQWTDWMAAEDRHYERDPTRQRADLVIDGTATMEDLPPVSAFYSPVDIATEFDELVEFLTVDEWRFHGRSALSRADVEAMEFSTDEVASFWINADGRRVGLIRLQDLGDVEDGSPVFDLRIAARSRGCGLGTAAVSWLTAHLFSTYPVLHRIEATTREDNTAMRRALERARYRPEGQLRESWLSGDGHRHDTMIYGILRTDLTTNDPVSI